MIRPAIHFTGNCYEAIKFYEEVFHVTDLEIDFYKDAPDHSDIEVTEDMKHLVMHASLVINGTAFNLSDHLDQKVIGDRICFNVFLDSTEAVSETYHKLEVEGQVVVELGPQFFSGMYGVVIDKFGVKWQLVS